MLAIAVFAVACEKKTAAPGRDTLARGERVVVEIRAAEFTEGQVLTVDQGKVRIQTLAEGEQIVADRGDIYRVSEILVDPKPLQYAICELQKWTWAGCQIEAVEEGGLRVISLQGEQERIDRNQVLQPSGATRLSQERLFAQARARGSFEAEARAAGRPRGPRGWRPTIGENVLARRGKDWVNARITGSQDAGLTVAWSEQEPYERIRRGEVVPRPPYPILEPPSPSSFALIAGAQGQQAWTRVRIESATDTDALVIDRDGKKKRVPLKELIPLQR